MADVYRKRSLEGFCKRRPSFNVEGMMVAYYKLHAEDGMLSHLSRRCSHDACTRTPSWGLPREMRPLYAPAIRAMCFAVLWSTSGKMQGGRLWQIIEVGTPWEPAYTLPTSRPLQHRSRLYCFDTCLQEMMS